MEKHKFASISLTVQNRVISLKFSTHRVSKKCTLGNFQISHILCQIKACAELQQYALEFNMTIDQMDIILG